MEALPPRPGTARKLFSISGVLPLGAFLLLHLWTTAALLTSNGTYERQVGVLHGGGLVFAIEVLLVILPLAFHGLYGIAIALQPRPEAHAYENHVMLSLERISGLVVLLFVVAHLRATMVPAWTGQLMVGGYSSRLVEQLSTLDAGIPFTALGYLIGLAATVFHLVNGLCSFCVTWGYVRGAHAQRRATLVLRGVGVALFVIGSATVVTVATGARFFGPEAATNPALCGSAARPAVLAPLPSASH